jgi:hypothetical protein
MSTPIRPASSGITQQRITNLRKILREAASGALEDAWIYLRDSGNIELESECLVLGDVEESLEYATALGFPQEALDSPSIGDCVAWAKSQESAPSDDLLFYAFRYYWLFDAFPTFAWAPDPPPPHEAMHLIALAFYRNLGSERPDTRCRHQGCQNGAIEHSVLCRRHHYEMVRKEPCPFIGEI